MKKPETDATAAAAIRTDKFQTQSDIETRIATIKTLLTKFAKGERGIGTLKKEMVMLEEKLKGMQNPTLI